MRDFRALLADDRCWDAHTQAAFDAHGEPIDDCILQNREELIRLCEVIEANEVRSFLEIGIWTGRLATTLHRLFTFDVVAACDHGYAETLGLTITLPPDARFLRDDSDSDAFLAFREELGAIDLVFIDANHSYRAVKQDLAINRRFRQRMIAFHDISGANRYTRGVAKLWGELRDGGEGHCLEIIEPHPEIGSTAPTMGIGIWSPHPIATPR